MKLVWHLLRCGLAGVFVGLAIFGLMIGSLPSSQPAAATAPAAGVATTGVGQQLVEFAVFGGMCAIAAALLLLLFRVGPIAKVFVGAFAGPVLPVLLLSKSLVAEGKGQDLAGLVFLCMVIGLLIGGLDASRVARLRRESEAV
jgi:hypothetical protein